METKEYFEKVMQDYNQNRKGRNLRKYCSDEGIDYKWLSSYKKQYTSTKGTMKQEVWRWQDAETKVYGGEELPSYESKEAKELSEQANVDLHSVVQVLQHRLFKTNSDATAYMKGEVEFDERRMNDMEAFMPQSSLNKWIHEVMQCLRERLQGLMLEVIKSSSYTHNDETRILVRNLMEDKAGSHGAAENLAFMYSLYESCKMNNLNFGRYIEDILTRMKDGDKDYRAMLPCYYVEKSDEVKECAW